jgi:hypothetical protein
MIRNFEEVKRQLTELSDVVNKFKSEQVQLKIVDLIFGNAGLDIGGAESSDNTQEQPAGKPKRGRRHSARSRPTQGASAAPDGKQKKTATAKGSGPSAILQSLLEKGFFDKKKTISDVVNHCKNNLARPIPMNQLSGPLARLVRDEKLSRNKNAENQYEYIKK